MHLIWRYYGYQAERGDLDVDFEAPPAPAAEPESALATEAVVVEASEVLVSEVKTAVQVAEVEKLAPAAAPAAPEAVSVSA